MAASAAAFRLKPRGGFRWGLMRPPDYSIALLHIGAGVRSQFENALQGDGGL